MQKKFIIAVILAPVLFVVMLYILNEHSPRSHSEAAAVGSLRTINVSESLYAEQFPTLGFACALNKLGPNVEHKSTSDAADLIDPTLSDGTKSDYHFVIQNCIGTPVKKYQVIAVPLRWSKWDWVKHWWNDPGLRPSERFFCTDEKGVIVSAHNNIPETAEACLKNGIVL